MSIFTTYRQQDTLESIGGDGDFGNPRINNRAELVFADAYAQWVMDGNVFNVSHTVQETLVDISENGRGSDNVNPALLLDVPQGTTVFPLEVLVGAGLDGTSQDTMYTINTDDATRFSSGGTAVTPLNMRKDDPRISRCSFYDGGSTITASANTDDDTIFMLWTPAEVTPFTAIVSGPTLNWSARKFTPPCLVGPSSLLVFVDQAAADVTYFYSVKWAEFETAQVV